MKKRSAGKSIAGHIGNPPAGVIKPPPPPSPPINPLAEMDYEELREHLCNLPQTWYPDLFMSMTVASYQKNVWVRPNGCSSFVKKVEARIERDAKQ